MYISSIIYNYIYIYTYKQYTCFDTFSHFFLGMDAISWEMLSNNTSQAVSLESSVCPDLASREHVVGVPDNHVLRQDSAGLYIYIILYN